MDACVQAVDCKWGAWRSWSKCVAAPDMCGVGLKTRSREIQTMPQGDGRLCPPRHREEVAPVVNCNGQPQCCINAEWAIWGEWDKCSASCGNGTRVRHRALKVKKTWCGEDAPGADAEYSSCNSLECPPNQDCKFSDWSEPSACSAECHGLVHRNRTILVNSTGTGNHCHGETEITERCNPAEGQSEPPSCAGKLTAGALSCEMTVWSEWDGCSVTCGRGSQTRYRHIQVKPQNGGTPCPPSTKEIHSCEADISCPVDGRDCSWGDWTAFSACDASGQRMRTRGIEQYETSGGLACRGPVREIDSCAECVSSMYTCRWGRWSTWSACSQTCGQGGVRKRNRNLVLERVIANSSENAEPNNASDAVSASSAVALSALESVHEEAKGGRARQITLLFAVGSVSLVAISLVARVVTMRSRLFHRSSEPEHVRVFHCASDYGPVPQNP